MRIIVIEDDIMVAELLADAIRHQGHSVRAAQDGKEGLELVRQQRPDAVFLDLRLGGDDMSGIEVLRSIRTMDSTLPVLVVTGHPTGIEIEEAESLGVVGVIGKPLLLGRLSAALSQLAAAK